MAGPSSDGKSWEGAPSSAGVPAGEQAARKTASSSTNRRGSFDLANGRPSSSEAELRLRDQAGNSLPPCPFPARTEESVGEFPLQSGFGSMELPPGHCYTGGECLGK